MKTSNFLKVSLISLLALFAVIGGASNLNVKAGLFQATEAASTEYPPCPPTATMPATMATVMATATSMATEEATATMAATEQETSAATVGTGPGYLGIRATGVDDCGVRILEVFGNSPALKAGLKIDDVIVAVNDTAVSSLIPTSTPGTPSAAGTQSAVSTVSSSAITLALIQLIETHHPGETITITVQRDDEDMDIEVTLGVIPPTPTVTATTGGTGPTSIPFTATPIPTTAATGNATTSATSVATSPATPLATGTSKSTATATKTNTPAATP